MIISPPTRFHGVTFEHANATPSEPEKMLSKFIKFFKAGAGALSYFLNIAHAQSRSCAILFVDIATAFAALVRLLITVRRLYTV